MAARSRARLRALEILFEVDQRGAQPEDVLAGRAATSSEPLNPYISQLVLGVSAHRERIDELLAAHSQGWDLDRMPGVDRCVLRLGVYELLWEDDVPDHVVLAEAVALAASMSTDESPAFVNGLLGSIVTSRPGLLA